MIDDTAKFEAIAPSLRWMPKWVRENLSPRAVWTVIGLAFTSGGWIAHESGSRMALEHANADLRQSQTDQIKATQDLNSTVVELNTKVAVLLTKVDDIGDRVDEQARKWERVEDTAETFRVPKQHHGPSRSAKK
jgi:hypothetical protein